MFRFFFTSVYFFDDDTDKKSKYKRNNKFKKSFHSLILYHSESNLSKEADVRRIRIDDFRHTFASHYVMSEGTIYDLQQLLGHSDVKTTMRYAHLSPNHPVKTADIIDYGVFAQPVKP